MADRSNVRTETITVNEIQTGSAEFLIMGTMPLIVNRVSEKARRDLLVPPTKKNAAERASTMKHDPIAEFRASPYLTETPTDPTYLVAPSMWFKNGMKSAALDLPGTTKTQIGRLCYVRGEFVPLWGIPELLMSVVRDGDMNHTPNIRTRTIIREWACIVPISWMEPNLTMSAIANLMSAAGLISGAGDWRQQKGAGSYGQYRVMSSMEDPDFLRITGEAGYAAQVAAMETPVAYDRDSRELLEYYGVQLKERGRTATKEKAVPSV